MTPKTYKALMITTAILLAITTLAAGYKMYPAFKDYKRLQKQFECGDNNLKECL